MWRSFLAVCAIGSLSTLPTSTNAQFPPPGGGVTESSIEEPSINFEISASLEPQNENLLGDSIDFQDGSLSIHHTDVALPGNSVLPVAFSRRYAADGADYFNGILGGWNLDVPFVTYRLLTEYASQHTTPCTGTMLPPASGTGASVTRDQYWAGVTMFIPGGGGQLLLENPTGGTTLYGGAVPQKTTVDHAKVSCLASVQNGSGQGFIATTTDGTEYRFDYKHEFPAGDLNFYTGACLEGNFADCDRGNVVGNSKPMTRVNLYASRVTDVNGNWVDYDYLPNGRLTRIESNDGRVITIGYGGDGRISTVTANGRSWSYTYAVSNKPNSALEYLTELRRVVLPDGRDWEFVLPTMSPHGRELACWMNIYANDAGDGTVTHPNGVVGTFVFRFIMNGKNAVPELPNPQPPGEVGDFHSCNDYQIPKYTVSRGVTSKTLDPTGPESHTWTFTYHEDLGFFTNYASNDLKQRTLTDPNGDKTFLFYNRRHDDQLEGKLIRSERADANDNVLEITTPTYLKGPGMGLTSVKTVISPPDNYIHLTATTTTDRGGDVYSTDYTYNINLASSSYSFGRPTKVERYSTLQTGARITDTVYTHKKTNWVVGLPSSITRNGKLFDEYTYDSLGRPIDHDMFGVDYKAYTYHNSPSQAAGRIASMTNRAGDVWQYTSYKRGQPQSITRPDSVVISQVVDNNGWVTSQTNARGHTTGYTHNDLGWITGIDRPAGFADTDITYDFNTLPVPGSVMRQIIVTGSKREVNHYDGFLRVFYYLQNPVDGSTPGINRRTAYDGLGREIFTSFPSLNYIQPHSPTAQQDGVETSYDPLGRVIETRETVSPFATTTTAYLSDNRVRVTDPMSSQTTTKSSGYGSPDDGNVIQIIDALNASTDMTYDIYGNITQFSQAGTQSGYTASITRNFWYDWRLRLCRHATPEMGDELFQYTVLDQIYASSRGEASGTDCAFPSTSLRTVFTYDDLGRVTNVDFPAGTSDIATTYDANGNETKVTRGGAVWDYAYDALDQITMEKLAIDGHVFQFDYTRNANGFVTSHSSPSGATFDYAPDGLGRPTKVATGGVDYIHSVTYHANGAVASGSYDNGQLFTQSLNSRQLPSLLQSYKPGVATVMQLVYGYNARGQVSSISDTFVSSHNRTFTYDAKGRLTGAGGSWGTGSFKYDALDNIREKKLGARTVALSYNADNLVSQVTDTANPTRNFIYDDRGNTTNDGRFTFTYDEANQPTAVSGGGVSNTYVYDGNRKRAKYVMNNGAVIYDVYSRVTGKVLYRRNVTANFKFDRVAIGPLDMMFNNGAPNRRHHLDHLGSAIANTDASGAVIWREHYSPFGERQVATHNGNFNSFTGHSRDADTGLNYMQARFYDPVIGRFLATDPIGYQDQFNLYAYVANDPVNLIDPDGRKFTVAEDQTENDDGTTTTDVTITLTAAVRTNGGSLPEGVTEESYAAQLGADFERDFTKSFTDADGNVTNYTAVADFTTGTAKGDQHQINIVSATDSRLKQPGGGYAAGNAVLFGRTINISETASFRTGTHEIGHSAGLDHPNPQLLPNSLIGVPNLMTQSRYSSSRRLTPSQLNSIRENKDKF